VNLVMTTSIDDDARLGYIPLASLQSDDDDSSRASMLLLTVRTDVLIGGGGI